MIIRTLQWNIGGGLVRLEESDPKDSLSYSVDGIEAIIQKIREYHPDIITLQETHSN